MVEKMLHIIFFGPKRTDIIIHQQGEGLHGPDKENQRHKNPYKSSCSKLENCVGQEPVTKG